MVVAKRGEAYVVGLANLRGDDSVVKALKRWLALQVNDHLHVYIVELERRGLERIVVAKRHAGVAVVDLEGGGLEGVVVPKRHASVADGDRVHVHIVLG